MTINAEQAVAAAQLFSSRYMYDYWSPSEIKVSKDKQNGRECWIVTTPAPATPEEPLWGRMNYNNISYLIGDDTGLCFGVDLGSKSGIFVFPDDNPRGNK